MIVGVIIFIAGVTIGVIIMEILQATKKSDELQDPQEYYDVDTEITGDLVLNYDIIHVISNNACKTVFHSEVFDEPFTLGDCEDMLDIIQHPIIVVAENPLDGAVFRYGNHKGTGWEKVGTTEGYA